MYTITIKSRGLKEVLKLQAPCTALHSECIMLHPKLSNKEKLIVHANIEMDGHGVTNFRILP